MSSFIACPGRRCGVNNHLAGSLAAQECARISQLGASGYSGVPALNTVKQVDYDSLVAQLAQDCVGEEMDVLREVALDNDVDLDDLCEAVMAAEEDRMPKTLAQVRERRREDNRVMAASNAKAHRFQLVDDFGFLPPHQLRETFDHADAWMKQVDAEAAIESEEWSQWLSNEELHAIDDYTGSAHMSVNRALRGKIEMGRSDEELIFLLDSALDKAELLPEPTVVYRGALAPDGVSQQEWLDSSFAVGDEIEFPGYLSCSWDPAVALGFTDRKSRASVVLEIKTRQGASLSTVSNFGGAERERLLSRGCLGEVVAIHHDVPFETKLGGNVTYQTVVQIVEYSALEETS